jgi:hypothetical protein
MDAPPTWLTGSVPHCRLLLSCKSAYVHTYMHTTLSAQEKILRWHDGVQPDRQDNVRHSHRCEAQLPDARHCGIWSSTLINLESSQPAGPKRGAFPIRKWVSQGEWNAVCHVYALPRKGDRVPSLSTSRSANPDLRQSALRTGGFGGLGTLRAEWGFV